MQRMLWVLVLGTALGLSASAEPTVVKLAPAAEEVQALREAWGKVLQVLEEFVVEIKGSVETLSKNDQDLLARYRVLVVQLKDLEAKLLQLQELWTQKIPTLERGISDCLSQIALLRKSLEEVQAGYRAADAALEAKIVTLATQLDAKISTLATQLESQMATLASQIEQVSKRVGVLESYDIGNLSRRVLSLEQAIQAVQIKIENNREKIAAVEKSLGGFAADIAALKESVLSLEARVSDHAKRIAAVEESLGANVQDLSARLDSIQVLAILGLLAGLGALVLMFLGLGG